MPTKKTIERARRDLRRGKAASTAAGEFIREEMRHLREGKHGGSRKEAIAIGLAKARRAGVPLGPRPESTEEKAVRRAMQSAFETGRAKRRKSRATKRSRKRRPARA